MKKITLTLLLIFIAGVNLYAQDQKVVEIKYAATFDGNEGAPDKINPFIHALINEEYSSITLQNEDGKYSYISKTSEAPAYTFLNDEDKTYLKLEHDYEELDIFEIDLSSTETKMIQGYTCQLAIINIPTDEGEYKIQIWYTQNIPNFYLNNFLFLKKVPGAALQIATEDYSIDAFEIVKTTKPLSTFEIPEDYTEMEVDSAVEYNEIGDNRYYYEDETGTYFGMRDGEDNIITQPIYSGMMHFKGDVCIVTNEEGKYGAIDYNGKEILPLKFDYLDHEPINNQYIFSENENFGLMKDGKIIIPAQYQLVSFISNGYAIFTENYKNGIIDENNKVIVPAKYNSIQENSSTLFVNMDDKGIYSLHRISDGKELASKYDLISLSQDSDLVLVQKNNKYGYVNKDGKIVIPIQYAYATVFTAGLAVVSNSEDFSEVFYIDTTGKKSDKTY
ncbi:WG repeat-containing protein [Sphingobacterium bovistauri]|uniref:WG repeat-containing protein n=1 Tax=Sphingobacterium bovistauri TaxID=2781959 RepID=A0ABS7Z889_9SPHI|nr:WG repeat-containing protein [Sphingobacterium bovistauri]MCA5005080.1 WG repeat-containing protein [Sphingobacterium bovistauri]